MLYRKLGKTDCSVSILGFGCMRLPLRSGSLRRIDRFDPAQSIDEEEAERMVRYAIEKGVNYFDTAYTYHSGKNELFLGRALKGDRERVLLATKLPPRQARRSEDFDRLLDEQLRKLDTHYLDVYLLHGLDRQRWAEMKALRILDFLDRIRTDGRARFVGFSFHDEVRTFKEIVDAYDWTLCQFQYNYFDESYQAGKEGLLYAASKGLGVVIMEPLRGGKLTDRIPREVQAVWDSAQEKRTPAEWALRWVWNHPEVSTVLSGMSAFPQIVENIELADRGKAHSLSNEELSLIQRVKQTYNEMLTIDCTGCGYCMPCPQGVNIPLNFNLFNDAFMFKDPETDMFLYSQVVPPEQRAAQCAECGECEERCPQHLRIAEELKKVHRKLYREKTSQVEKP